MVGGWRTDDDNIKAFLQAFNDLNSRKSEACCHCGKHVERMEKIRRSVYARPCGCRLWQGTIPEAWKNAKP